MGSGASVAGVGKRVIVNGKNEAVRESAVGWCWEWCPRWQLSLLRCVVVRPLRSVLPPFASRGAVFVCACVPRCCVGGVKRRHCVPSAWAVDALGCRSTHACCGWPQIVKFIGKTELGTGNWVGVELAKKVGNHDGEVKGKRYFTCKKGHGLMVREEQVQVGLPRSPSTRTSASPSLCLASAVFQGGPGLWSDRVCGEETSAQASRGAAHVQHP